VAEGEVPAQEGAGVGGKAVVVSVSVAAAYMLLVLALMLYCRRRRLARRQRGIQPMFKLSVKKFFFRNMY
jgi:hypothetical protein